VPGAGGSLAEFRSAHGFICLPSKPGSGSLTISAYLYEVQYDFVVTGSEDEQKLSRWTDADAQRYLSKE
jgi:hypothetical protein